MYLRQHFAEGHGEYGFLADEAHNLVARAREMFSADLDNQEILEVRRALQEARSALRQSGGQVEFGDAEAWRLLEKVSMME